MINRRGLVAVLISAAASLAIGWNAGSFRHDMMCSTAGVLCKEDRLK